MMSPREGNARPPAPKGLSTRGGTYNLGGTAEYRRNPAAPNQAHMCLYSLCLHQGAGLFCAYKLHLHAGFVMLRKVAQR